MKKLFEFLTHRIVTVGLSILLQVAVLVVVIWRFNNYFVYFYGISTLLSIFVVLYLVNSRMNPSYKIAWIIPIMLFPIFGGLFYLLFGGNKLPRKARERMSSINAKTQMVTGAQPEVMKALEQDDRAAAAQSRYIESYAMAPAYIHTKSEFLPSGEVKFERLKEELQKAEHYIFLEYFIIQEGIFWDAILEILKEKAAQGLDVRVIYDDAGCLFTLPKDYDKTLETMGIKACIFNPFIPVLSPKLNNRDHRKIVVIDGHVGFTGGINLADEYINAYPKHGHWKDAAILLKGDAVWSLTVMFLSMWDYIQHEDSDYTLYRPEVHHEEDYPTEGLVQPFCDSPLDDEIVGETVYLNLINRAERYVYINTPYLIVDHEMMTALSNAAKSGVDVRIVTPHVADKWYVHAVTRAYYEQLVEAGVKIYEYTPGFVHAKTFAADDKYGVVGTINLDYRSLYLHFECGVWLYKTQSVLQVRDDYLKTLEVCTPITAEWCKNQKWYQKLIAANLRVFAPLM